MDFMRGAALAPHGRPILALPATARAPKTSGETHPYALTPVDGQISRIVPILTPGAAVTTTRAHVHYVVTEYGTAMLLGRSSAERARVGLLAPDQSHRRETAGGTAGDHKGPPRSSQPPSPLRMLMGFSLG